MLFIGTHFFGLFLTTQTNDTHETTTLDDKTRDRKRRLKRQFYYCVRSQPKTDISKILFHLFVQRAYQLNLEFLDL